MFQLHTVDTHHGYALELVYLRLKESMRLLVSSYIYCSEFRILILFKCLFFYLGMFKNSDLYKTIDTWYASPKELFSVRFNLQRETLSLTSLTLDSML